MSSDIKESYVDLTNEDSEDSPIKSLKTIQIYYPETNIVINTTPNILDKGFYKPADAPGNPNLVYKIIYPDELNLQPVLCPGPQKVKNLFGPPKIKVKNLQDVVLKKMTLTGSNNKIRSRKLITKTGFGRELMRLPIPEHVQKVKKFIGRPKKSTTNNTEAADAKEILKKVTPSSSSSSSSSSVVSKIPTYRKVIAKTGFGRELLRLPIPEPVQKVKNFIGRPKKSPNTEILKKVTPVVVAKPQPRLPPRVIAKTRSGREVRVPDHVQLDLNKIVVIDNSGIGRNNAEFPNSNNTEEQPQIEELKGRTCNQNLSRFRCLGCNKSFMGFQMTKHLYQYPSHRPDNYNEKTDFELWDYLVSITQKCPVWERRDKFCKELTNLLQNATLMAKAGLFKKMGDPKMGKAILKSNAYNEVEIDAILRNAIGLNAETNYCFDEKKLNKDVNLLHLHQLLNNTTATNNNNSSSKEDLKNNENNTMNIISTDNNNEKVQFVKVENFTSDIDMKSGPSEVQLINSASSEEEPNKKIKIDSNILILSPSKRMKRNQTNIIESISCNNKPTLNSDLLSDNNTVDELMLHVFNTDNSITQFVTDDERFGKTTENNEDNLEINQLTVNDDLKVSIINVEKVEDELKVSIDNVEDELKISIENVENVEDELKVSIDNVENVKVEDELKISIENVENVEDELKISIDNIKNVKNDLEINQAAVNDELKLSIDNVENPQI